MAAGRRSLVPALVAGFCALALSGPAGAIAAAPGLVAGYGFEEGTGAAVADASAAGNSGTVSGAARTRVRPVRPGAQLRRLQRHRLRARCQLARPHERHDAGGVGEAAALGPLGSAILKERTGSLVYGLYAGTNTGMSTRCGSTGSRCPPPASRPTCAPDLELRHVGALEPAGDPAEVEHERGAVDDRLVVDRGVGGDDDRQLDPLERLVQRR